MSTSPLFPGFDGLMNLSKREGVDIRPTLLRVLTDLYVQAAKHTEDEQRQFAELVSRLIDVVDAATRAAVRARLAVCDDTPDVLAVKLGLAPKGQPGRPETERQADLFVAAPRHLDTDEPVRGTPVRLTIRPDDAAEIDRIFSVATAIERARILHNLSESPLAPAARPGPRRSARAIETLEMAAFAGDTGSFAVELSNTLLLPARTADRIVDDAGAEPIACACKAVGMPEETFQRVLLFLKPALGASVTEVFRLARLYAVLSERAALIMISVWRGATMAQAQARYRPSLYDEQRQRARPSSVAHPQSTARPAQPQINRLRS